MTKTPFCEYLIKDILPLVRISLSKHLYSRGFTQARIAERIGVTQAAVNYYLKKTEDYVDRKTQSCGLTRSEIESYANQLSSLVVDSESRNRCLLCGYEQPEKLQFPRGEGYQCLCSVVLGISRADGTRDSVLNDIERAVSMLSGSETFPEIMPEVSVNIVMALPKPRNELDVASIPGRIVKIRGKARSLAKPEFGVSNHMARVLLAAVNYSSEIKAATNIAYTESVENAMNHLHLRVSKNKRRSESEEGERAAGDDVVLESVRKTLLRSQGKVDAIIDEGGFGLEPNVYLFGPNAFSVARTALEIADQVHSLSLGKERNGKLSQT